MGLSKVGPFLQYHCQTGREDKNTRPEYKDKKKVDARFDMARIVSNLNLSEAILDLGHRYFCFYRDLKDKVVEMPRREAQCLILALRKKKEEGYKILKEYKGEQALED